MATTKKVKKKLNVKALIIMLLIIYLIVMFFYTFFTLPIQNIYIKNTSLISDNEIIEIAGIKKYPPIFKLNSAKMEKKIESLELVSNATVKKKLNGKLIITIDEAIPLVYNRNTEKVILSNGEEVATNSKYLGIPTLINYVPSELLQEFITAFSEVDSDIIKMINEIEYDPDIKEDVTIDANRFLVRMNDTNNLYVNIINMERINNYKEFFAIIGDTRGILYLDSYDSNNDLLGLFTPYEPVVDEDDEVIEDSENIGDDEVEDEPNPSDSENNDNEGNENEE